MYMYILAHNIAGTCTCTCSNHLQVPRPILTSSVGQWMSGFSQIDLCTCSYMYMYVCTHNFWLLTLSVMASPTRYSILRATSTSMNGWAAMSLRWVESRDCVVCSTSDGSWRERESAKCAHIHSLWTTELHVYNNTDVYTCTVHCTFTAHTRVAILSTRTFNSLRYSRNVISSSPWSKCTRMCRDRQWNTIVMSS